MKNSTLLLASTLLCFTSFACLAGEQYKIDPQHSHVLWHISHFGFSNPSGKWMVNGTLDYDEKDPQNSQATASIDLAKIITGNPELDKHLTENQFFDVKAFPEAYFKTHKVTVVDHKIKQVEGDLTLHGVTRPIQIEVQQNKIGKNPITDKLTMGFSGETTLKRSDFGIKTMVPQLGDEIKLNIEVEAYKQ